MIRLQNIIIEGASGKSTLIDVSYPMQNANGKLIIYLHGFKSFKDWGFHPYISNALAQEGYTVVKLNFSNNGVGVVAEDCLDFIDLEAFGNNNFSKELADIEALIGYLNLNKATYFTNIDIQSITIIGHSKGGGMAIIAAEKFECITSLITLNGVDDFDNILYGINENTWREKGVHYIANARTKQQMPLYYQLYQDYIAHKSQFDILDKVAKLAKPYLCIHATKDETVKMKAAHQIKACNANVELKLIENTGHTFGATHPMLNTTLALEQCLDYIKYWLKSVL